MQNNYVMAFAYNYIFLNLKQAYIKLNTMNSKQIGDNGELLAINFLKNNGYKIVETNWRCQRYEIDIIAFKNNEIIIVEVKTRATDFFGSPEDAVDKRKRKKIIITANAFLEQRNIDFEVRFDIISILNTKNGNSIKHIKDAFMAFEL